MNKAGLWGMAAGMGLAALVMWETHEPPSNELQHEVVDRNSVFSNHEYGVLGELLATPPETENRSVDETFSKEDEEIFSPKVKPTPGFMPNGMPSVTVHPF